MTLEGYLSCAALALALFTWLVAKSYWKHLERMEEIRRGNDDDISA